MEPDSGPGKSTFMCVATIPNFTKNPGRLNFLMPLNYVDAADQTDRADNPFTWQKPMISIDKTRQSSLGSGGTSATDFKIFSSLWLGRVLAHGAIWVGTPLASRTAEASV